MKDPKEPQPEPAVRRPAWQQWLFNRWTVSLGLFLLCYTLTGFFLAPWLVSRQLPRYVSEQLQHQASLGRVRINPFSFTIEATDFRLQDAGGEPILEFARLFVNFELESMFQRAWTFADIQMDDPALHLLIGKDGRLNLIKFLEMLPEKEKKPEEGPVPVLLKHLILGKGVLHFADYSGPDPVQTAFESLVIELNEISTLPERSGSYGLTAQLPEGGTLNWRGEASLSPLASNGTLNIKDFRPAAVWKFLQESTRLAAPEGLAQLKLDYRFSHHNGETSMVVHPLDFALKDFALKEKDREQPLLRLESLEIPGAHFDLAQQQLRFPAISLRRGELAVGMDQNGVLDWQRLLAPAKDADGLPQTEADPEDQEKPKAPEDGENKPWKLGVDAFTVEALALRYADASRGAPYSLDIKDAALSLTVEAEAGNGPAKVSVADLSVLLQGISSQEPSGKEPLWTLASARLDGGSLDLAERRLGVEALALSGGTAKVLRTGTGTIRQAQVYGSGAKARTDTAEKNPADSGEAPPWKLALNRLELADFALNYADQGFEPALKYDLRDLALTVEGFDTESKNPLQVAASTKVAQGGALEAKGSVAHSGEEASGRLKVSRLNLKPLEPVLTEHVLLRLASGDLSLDSRLSYKKTKSGATLKADGNAGISRFLLTESASGERFLAWKELALSGVDFNLVPKRLTIREVKLMEPESKITIFKDRSTNLAKIFKEKPTQAETAVKTEKAEPKTEKVPAEQKPFQFNVERVRMEKGVVDFADLSLVLPFAARVEKFEGTALNISDDPASRTTLKFSGQVGEFGQANVDGSLAPLAPKHFTDIKVAFRNVELGPLSPYTATFAGRRIAEGRLDLDLVYKIEDSELLGDNKVLLKKFTLGERVESPGALKLPLDLAIAILTDTQGRIDIAMPVRGNVDSPEFSYGHLIWQAVLNVLNKIVTAPFRALGALFGSGAQQPDTVFFAAGQTEPAPPEREKLRKVVEVLAQRPQLALIVQGSFARDLDGEALRSLAVRRSLAQRLDVALGPDEDPGPVAFDNAKTQRALEAMAGAANLAAFQSGFEKTTGRKARRANPALALLGKGSDDLDFYRALFEHLVEKEPLAEEKLQTLAAERRDAVIRELAQGAGLGPERVTAGTVAETEAKDGSVPLRMELGAAENPRPAGEGS